MTRHIIAFEDKPSILPETRLKTGSLWVEADSVPVTWNFDWEQNPIGYASDLQRDETSGEVSMEIIFTPQGEAMLSTLSPEDQKLFDYTFWADRLVEERVEPTDDDEGYRLITSARIRGLALVPKAANPAR